MSRNIVILAAIFVAFASGLATGRVSDRDAQATDAVSSPVPASLEQSRTGSALAVPPGGLPDLSTIAERAIQASVNISSTEQVQMHPFFRMMYGDVPQSQTSMGSGVFVSPDGYVLTNSHVVGGPRADIRVTLTDSRELPAKVIGVDPESDLAVLKVDVKGAATLPWGDSNKLRVAEWVLAVGNPFQFNQTVTLGIVSAQNRHDPQLATYNDFIQTDAAINPGNSGGALVNSRGELVGINTMIYSQTGGYQGIGFAVPSNLVRRTFETLKSDGEVVRGSIGNLTYLTVTSEQVRAARIGTQGGVYVQGMYRTDPAYAAGIRPRDIIVAFNGKPVTEQSQLQRLIADTRIGSTARVEVLRGSDRRTFEVPVVRMTSSNRR
jgi:serine protease Do